MLTINKEFRKGILFVRLLGVLNKNNVKRLNEEVTTLVLELKITNVVFNINELKTIDIDGINELLKINNICKLNNGISILCGGNSIVLNKIDFMKNVCNELVALELIKV